MNWEKFKEMSTKEKLKWIVHYYGIVIVVGIIAICVISNLLIRMFGSREEFAVKAIILDDRCSDDERIALREKLTEDLGAPCELTAYLASDEMQFQAFAVRLSGDGELDLVIAPEPQMKELENNGYFSEMVLIPEEAWYYGFVDEEDRFPEKNLYLGITGNRELEPGILEQVKSLYFGVE